MVQSNYEILGVRDEATKTEIRDAFRKLVLEHHSDRGGNDEQFKKIKQAFDDLKLGKKFPDSTDFILVIRKKNKENEIYSYLAMLQKKLHALRNGQLHLIELMQLMSSFLDQKSLDRWSLKEKQLNLCRLRVNFGRGI